MRLRLRDVTSGQLVEPRQPLVQPGAAAGSAQPGLSSVERLLALRQQVLRELIATALAPSGASAALNGAASRLVIRLPSDALAADPPAGGCTLQLGAVLAEGAEADDRQQTPAALRYLVLSARYSAPLLATPGTLAGAAAASEALCERVQQLAELAGRAPAHDASGGAIGDELRAALADDLDTPRALGLLWQALHSDLPPAARLAVALEADEWLGLGLAALATAEEQALSAEASALAAERDAARRDRDWARSDQLRDQLAALGVDVQDSREGSTYRSRASS